MTIATALRKIDRLSHGELLHCVQRLDTEIAHYERVIRNYSQEKMRRFGQPYLRHLQAQRQQFQDRL